jgi:hypothetical protein
MDRFDHRIEEGVYIVDTSKRRDGPPIGTETFDTRRNEDIPHCAG